MLLLRANQGSCYEFCRQDPTDCRHAACHLASVEPPAGLSISCTISMITQTLDAIYSFEIDDWNILYQSLDDFKLKLRGVYIWWAQKSRQKCYGKHEHCTRQKWDRSAEQPK